MARIDPEQFQNGPQNMTFLLEGPQILKKKSIEIMYILLRGNNILHQEKIVEPFSLSLLTLFS